MKTARWIGYTAIVVGVVRIVDYYYFGNAHHHHALVWALHALIVGPIVIWLTFWIPKKEKEREEQ